MPTKFDETVAQAMKVHDTLNEQERRNVYETTIRALATDTDLQGFRESMLGMVRLETQHPEVRAAIRAASAAA